MPNLFRARLYKAPWREHIETKQDFENTTETQNAALRRRNNTYRRRTNTYEKHTKDLQRTLDIHQVIRQHWTAGVVPAVVLNIIEGALFLEDILTNSFV